MSDFCRACIVEEEGPEYADRNGMGHEGDGHRWGVCEGCGWGWFNQAGERQMRRKDEAEGDR